MRRVLWASALGVFGLASWAVGEVGTTVPAALQNVSNAIVGSAPTTFNDAYQPTHQFTIPSGAGAQAALVKVLEQICPSATNCPGDARILFTDGTSPIGLTLGHAYKKPVILQAQNPYRAHLYGPGHRVFGLYGASNLKITGFEISGNNANGAEYLVQIAETSSAIVIENCIVHDALINDSIKINDGSHHIVLRGNLLYNADPCSSCQLADINTVHDVIVEDNVFFNDFARGNDTHGLVVIKNSGATAVSKNFTVRRNIFMNWEGQSDEPMLLFGEDGAPFYEAQNVLVENNLFLVHTANPSAGAFHLKGVANVKFRANTIVGSTAPRQDSYYGYAVRIQREGQNPVLQNLFFYNNVWSDVLGAMVNFAGGNLATETRASTVVLHRNAYFNHSRAIPDPAGTGEVLLHPKYDPYAIYTDPLVGHGLISGTKLVTVTTPKWNANTKRFGDGVTTIPLVRAALVQSYATPPTNSPLRHAASGDMPAEDILNRPRARTGARDLGAVEF